jgi:hypothetical protein
MARVAGAGAIGANSIFNGLVTTATTATVEVSNIGAAAVTSVTGARVPVIIDLGTESIGNNGNPRGDTASLTGDFSFAGLRSATFYDNGVAAGGTVDLSLMTGVFDPLARFTATYFAGSALSSSMKCELSAY